MVKNVTEKIRTQEVGKAASDVAVILAVRQKLRYKTEI